MRQSFQMRVCGLCLLLLLVVSGCDSAPSANKNPAPASTTSFAATCMEQKAVKLRAAEELLKSGKPWEAHVALYQCADATADVEMMQRSREAEISAYSQRVADKKMPIEDRARNLERIAATDPVAASKLETKHKIHDQLVAWRSKEQKRIAAEKRSQGVSIGMSADDVLASSWGRPERVNRTTTAFGVREQWVYSGGGYLYFENGRLTAIQN